MAKRKQPRKKALARKKSKGFSMTKKEKAALRKKELKERQKDKIFVESSPVLERYRRTKTKKKTLRKEYKKQNLTKTYKLGGGYKKIIFRQRGTPEQVTQKARDFLLKNGKGKNTKSWVNVGTNEANFYGSKAGNMTQSQAYLIRGAWEYGKKSFGLSDESPQRITLEVVIIKKAR